MGFLDDVVDAGKGVVDLGRDDLWDPALDVARKVDKHVGVEDYAMHNARGVLTSAKSFKDVRSPQDALRASGSLAMYSGNLLQPPLLPLAVPRILKATGVPDAYARPIGYALDLASGQRFDANALGQVAHLAATDVDLVVNVFDPDTPWTMRGMNVALVGMDVWGYKSASYTTTNAAAFDYGLETVMQLVLGPQPPPATDPDPAPEDEDSTDGRLKKSPYDIFYAAAVVLLTLLLVRWRITRK